MAKLSKAQVERHWKKELRDSGFEFAGGMFRREKPGGVHQIIGIQRNTLQPVFKIHVQIAVLDRFLPTPESRLCLGAHLRKDGVFFRENETSWWPESEITGAMPVIIQHGIPWLEFYGDGAVMVRLLETGVAEKKKLESILEAQQDTGSPIGALLRSAFPSGPESATVPASPPMYFYHLSLLCHSLDNYDKGCKYAQEWLQHISKPGKMMPHEPERTQRLMDAMRCSEG